ncbi:hypothetical protein XPN_1566, partial [Xanthomonas arboricola pv. pruni MAFF 301427]
MLACLAVLLMLVAPLISRWSQAQSPEPMCMSGPALDAGGSLHADHQALPAQTAAHHHAAAAPPAKPNTGDHAGAHGEACDYCVLAARLLPWLALLVLCLLQARPRRRRCTGRRAQHRRCAGPHSGHVGRRCTRESGPIAGVRCRCSDCVPDRPAAPARS